MSKTSTTPMAGTTAGSGTHLSTPNVFPLRSPGIHTDVRSSSPNYFSLNIDPSSERRDSGAGPKDNWSSPTSSIRSFNPQSPIHIAVDSNPEFEAFRKQSEAAHAFNLGRSSLHSLGTPPLSTPFSRPHKSAVDGISIPPRGTPRLKDQDEDKMELDVGGDSAQESTDSKYAPQGLMNPPSFFDMPRQASPASIGSRASPPPMARSILSRLEDRHPRLSLPGHRADPPSPRVRHHGQSHARAETLPSTLETGPSMIQPSHLQEIIGQMESHVLILDLRVSKYFAESRIRGALNLCLPTTLLKRSTFTVNKLTDTFENPEEKERFMRWKHYKYIVVYDASSTEKSDATSAVNTLTKFTNEGWKGHCYILRGGFNAFAKSFPQMIDHRSGSDTRPSKMNLSLGTSLPAVAPVAGGCEMPASKSAANPFFSNIRQNQDLIGGVGQIEVKRPEALEKRPRDSLPRWLQAASNPNDHGKKVAEKFHKIEVVEQARMTEALSTKVSYGTPDAKSKSVRIAGFEKGSKNRYNNIWPFEHARVKLKGRSSVTSDDYVNASHISASGSDKSYIASQGPLPSTYEDFWSVIWDYDVRVIVMLTAESEGGQLKCNNYWSDKNFGPYVLKSLSEKRASLDPKQNKHHRHESTAAGPQRDSPSSSSSANNDLFKLRKRAMTNIDEISAPGGPGQPGGAPGSEPPFAIVRKFTLSHSGFPFSPMREITQVHYTSWPDFGAPAQPAQVLALVELCEKLSRGPVIGEDVEMKDAGEIGRKQRPVLVHCSAGCGRTGTFCTIDSVLDMLRKQTKEVKSGAIPMELDHKERRRSSTRLDPVDELSPTSSTDFFSNHVDKMSLDTNMLDEPKPENKDKNEDEWLFNEDIDLIEKTVLEFREQRISMVQSLKQYVLCYETIMEWLVKQSVPKPGSLHRRQSEF